MLSTVLHLTHADFHSHVEASATLVVDFASTSEPSPDQHPLAQNFPHVTFARIDPASEPDSARMFGIAAAPALLIFREGIVLYLEAGAHTPQRIASLLDRIGALDLGQVRAAIAKERAETAVQMRRICPTALRGTFGQ
jgi:thioredoxin